jgi:hypothetical protein
MMEEIKFRGLSGDGWHYGNLSIIKKDIPNKVPAGYYISNDAGMPWAYRVYRGTVGQYTGLRDGEKREIYAGDILVPESYVNLSDPKFRCRVIFSDGMFCLKPGGFIAKKEPLSVHLRRGEKAGNRYIIMSNIHDDPELLEDENAAENP